MPYCLYVRKSRADAEAEARGEGETLARHIHALLDLAKRRHFDVTQIYKEIVSGETIAVGNPYIEGACVTGKVVQHGRGEKIRILKYKSKKNYRRKAGHRQPFTKVEITGVHA